MRLLGSGSFELPEWWLGWQRDVSELTILNPHPNTVYPCACRAWDSLVTCCPGSSGTTAGRAGASL